MSYSRKDSDQKQFSIISQSLLNTVWKSSPVEATILGVHQHDDTLGDLTASTYRNYANEFQGYIRMLESRVDPSKLSRRDALEYQIAMMLASSNFIQLAYRKQWEKDPSMYPSIAIWGCFSLILRDYQPIDERMRSVLSRMREIPGMLAIAKENLKDIPQVFALVAADVTDAGLSFFREVIPAVANDVPLLTKDILSANEAAITALTDYRKWLQETVLPSAHGDFAVGRKVYEQILFSEHQLTYSPEDLVKIAEGMLADLSKELTEVSAQIDPSLTWQELVAKLSMEHPPKEHIVDAYRNAMNAARDFVIEHDLATIPPGEHLDVRETPEFERSTTPYAAYMPSPPFGPSREGHFWVTPIDENAPEAEQKSQLLGHCIYTLPITALHEGYPGHHLQLTRAANSGSDLRKQVMSSVQVEGWALYCEHLMHEQGFYTDPRVRLFQLKDMLWRVCRVMIDVGLQTGSMTFEEAVRMLVDTARLEEGSAVAEVKRYTLSPTQPMTYVIGKMLIEDLRARMEKKLGSDFNLKRFHDDLLDRGSIPTPLITREMVSGMYEETLTGKGLYGKPEEKSA